MRSSVAQSRQLYHSGQAFAHRTFTSATNPSLTLCQKCRRNTAQPITINRLSRRWTSSTQDPEAQVSKEFPSSRNIPKTHYEFFPKTLAAGPPPTGPFIIDTRALRQEYLQLQAKAHPDLHPSSLKLRAEATSARINEAYKTLQNPLLRTQYLLSQRGINVAEDETAKTDDPELLMEVLDAREAIEEAQEEEHLDEMKLENEERIRRSEEVLDTAFKEDNLEEAKEEAVRLRYWVNIKESLDGWEKGKPVVLVH